VEGKTPATLYIFPHAGGSAKFYIPLARQIPAHIKRIAVQYPGQRGRHDPPPMESIPALADDIFRMLVPAEGLTGPIAFFGHSMGSLVAFEVALRFESAGHPLSALFVSACAAPGRMGHDYLQVSDGELLNVVSAVTGTNPAFLADPDFAATILPTLRSLRAITGYNCAAGSAVSCPLVAFLGDSDPIATYRQMELWNNLTTSGFSIREFQGDHFYINSHLPELAQEIETVIGRSGGDYRLSKAPAATADGGS
jgi:surfactin synthase thioesterase subunit